ncbi:TlpA disulfide reductase family protein [Lishizhenia sp.]|uniref:TlpA family protein disulfide reductase n=1 Tax=Lishizhenia sp. TaxID=2497594 RepID=UPI00299DA157|nr:TlpA disulfide reductase family protein [Lishizhenia sp.]MDX1446354.1 TlpA disulfide reductase family protein [Lishizhenia sp.]
MKYFLFIISSLLLLACSSEVKVDTSQKVDEFIHVDLVKSFETGGKGFSVYYPYSGIEDSIKERLVLPDLSEIQDTAYGYFYFSGENKGAINREVLFIVGNYNSSAPKFWLDNNNDFMFAANEQSSTFEDDFLLVRICDGRKKELCSDYTLIKPADSIYEEINGMIGELSTGGKHLGFYWSKRKSLSVGDFNYQGDSLRIGLFDVNTDGAFNTIGRDRLVFGDFGKSITRTAEYQGALTLDSMSFFNSKHYVFQILEIAADGSSMKIKPLESKKLLTRLGVGDTLPDFVLENVDEGSRSVYAGLKGQKYIYLNFWATWCGGCKQEMPDLIALNKDYTDEVYMLSINYEQDVETVKSFMDKYDMEWANALSTPEIIEAFKVEGMPRNVLLDGSGKILDMNIRPDKLMDLIEKAKVTPKQGV